MGYNNKRAWGYKCNCHLKCEGSRGRWVERIWNSHLYKRGTGVQDQVSHDQLFVNHTAGLHKEYYVQVLVP